jgi:hypothetical protein
MAAAAAGAGADGPDALATLTHARLRAEQGDVRGARRLLRAIVARRPDDERARELLARLGDRAGRVRRLEAWLARISRTRRGLEGSPAGCYPLRRRRPSAGGASGGDEGDP